jgi:hypothetical protein
MGRQPLATSPLKPRLVSRPAAGAARPALGRPLGLELGVFIGFQHRPELGVKFVFEALHGKRKWVSK